MAGAMLLATAACWWENCVTVTLTITKFQIYDQFNGQLYYSCVCAANLEISSFQLPEVVDSVGIAWLTQSAKYNRPFGTAKKNSKNSYTVSIARS